MIRLAAPGDAAAVAESYEELLLHEEREGGSSHWRRGVYPTPATAGRAQAAGWLYVLEEDGRLQGSVILNSHQAKEYRSIPWLYPAADSEVLVVHTLCVPPRCAGRGVGTRLVSAHHFHAAGRRAARQYSRRGAHGCTVAGGLCFVRCGQHGARAFSGSFQPPRF